MRISGPQKLWLAFNALKQSGFDRVWEQRFSDASANIIITPFWKCFWNVGKSPLLYADRSQKPTQKQWVCACYTCTPQSMRHTKTQTAYVKNASTSERRRPKPFHSYLSHCRLSTVYCSHYGKLHTHRTPHACGTLTLFSFTVPTTGRVTDKWSRFNVLQNHENTNKSPWFQSKL
jgi:hypothetical protein